MEEDKLNFSHLSSILDFHKKYQKGLVKLELTKLSIIDDLDLLLKMNPIFSMGLTLFKLITSLYFVIIPIAAVLLFLTQWHYSYLLWGVAYFLTLLLPPLAPSHTHFAKDLLFPLIFLLGSTLLQYPFLIFITGLIFLSKFLEYIQYQVFMKRVFSIAKKEQPIFHILLKTGSFRIVEDEQWVYEATSDSSFEGKDIRDQLSDVFENPSRFSIVKLKKSPYYPLILKYDDEEEEN